MENMWHFMVIFFWYSNNSHGYLFFGLGRRREKRREKKKEKKRKRRKEKKRKGKEEKKQKKRKRKKEKKKKKRKEKESMEKEGWRSYFYFSILKKNQKQPQKNVFVGLLLLLLLFIVCEGLSTSGEYSQFRFKHFKRHEPQSCTKGKWITEYTQLHHEILSGKRPFKALVTTCGPELNSVHKHQRKGCSGWGNQIEALEALFIAAVATKRALLISGYDASLSEGAVISPAINWSFKDAFAKFPNMMNMTWHHISPKHHANVDAGCTFENIKEATEEADILYMTEKGRTFILKMAELNNYNHAIKQNEEKQQYWGTNDLQTLMRNGCFLRYLFQPGPPLIEVLRKIQIPNYLSSRPSVGIQIRFGDSVFGLSKDHRSVSSLKGKDVIQYGLSLSKEWFSKACATVRESALERKWPANYSRTEAIYFHSLHFSPHHNQSLPSFSPSLTPTSSSPSSPSSFSSSTSSVPFVPLFVATDNASFIDDISETMTVYSAKEAGPISHPNLDKDARLYGSNTPEKYEHLRNSLFRLFSDFFLIGMSDIAIISQSKRNTFITASVRLGQVPLFPIEHVTKLLEKGDPTCSLQPRKAYTMFEPAIGLHVEKDPNKVCIYEPIIYNSTQKWWSETALNHHLPGINKPKPS